MDANYNEAIWWSFVKLIILFKLIPQACCEDCYTTYGGNTRACRAGWRCCGGDCCLENPFFALWYLWFLLALMLISCVMFICICCKWKKQHHLNHIHSAQHPCCPHHPSYPFHHGNHVFDVSGSMGQQGFGMYHPSLYLGPNQQMLPGYANEGLATGGLLPAHMCAATAPDLTDRLAAPPSYADLMHPKPPSDDDDNNNNDSTNNNNNSNSETIAKTEDETTTVVNHHANGNTLTTTTTLVANQNSISPRVLESLPPIGPNVGILSNQITAPEMNSQSDAPPAYQEAAADEPGFTADLPPINRSQVSVEAGTSAALLQRMSSETQPKVPITPRSISQEEEQ